MSKCKYCEPGRQCTRCRVGDRINKRAYTARKDPAKKRRIYQMRDQWLAFFEALAQVYDNSKLEDYIYTERQM